jgi:hypothetical protein
MKNLKFCSIILPDPQAEIYSLLLAESIRAFGGALSNNPIWFFMPDYGKPLTDIAQKQLQILDVHVMPFKFGREEFQFFFMDRLVGLEKVERACTADTVTLAWLDANTILLQEPKEFILPDGKSLGYCPVHHLLVGSRFDQPLDPFWEQIYKHCQVPPERVFPMQPAVEDIQMRPYFNAGILIVRPERGLFAKWCETFLNLCQAPVFQPFYKQDQRYVIFMHQAVLAGVMLRHLEPEEMLMLPESYNYPVHLFEQDNTNRRPSSMDELVTFRYEDFCQDMDWAEKFPASDPVKHWLAEQVCRIQHTG